MDRSHFYGESGGDIVAQVKVYGIAGQLDSAAHNWGFRGQLGDEIQLNYRVDV